MALGKKLIQMIAGDGAASRDEELSQVLSRLAGGKEPVMVEVENTRVRFLAKLIIRPGLLVITKPLNLPNVLGPGVYVRFCLPWNEEKELRMEVVRPHVNIANGNAVVVCRLPKEFANSTPRKGTRFDTGRYNNITLVLKDREASYRVLDLSVSGVKVDIKGHHKIFQVNQPMTGCELRLGGYRVPLASLVPRAVQGMAIGGEIQVAKEGHDAMAKMMKYLEDAQAKRISMMNAV
ncbi:MAG: hypothetical protein OEV94_10565 [Deltaproteobacteria bacterium]|nr:hypothetical protein [Deltaproteobacteria bacterium]